MLKGTFLSEKSNITILLPAACRHDYNNLEAVEDLCVSQFQRQREIHQLEAWLKVRHGEILKKSDLRLALSLEVVALRNVDAVGEPDPKLFKFTRVLAKELQVRMQEELDLAPEIFCEYMGSGVIELLSVTGGDDTWS